MRPACTTRWVAISAVVVATLQAQGTVGELVWGAGSLLAELWYFRGLSHGNILSDLKEKNR